jgi:gluconolactonase
VPFAEGPVWCPDGTVVATSVAEGALYRITPATTIEHGIRVVDPDGTVIDFLALDGDGLTTNCCFGGPELRTLFVTDAIPGRVLAFDRMPQPGLPLPAWPGVL